MIKVTLLIHHQFHSYQKTQAQGENTHVAQKFLVSKSKLNYELYFTTH